MHAGVIIPGRGYGVMDTPNAQDLRKHGVEVIVEGDTDFAPVWVRNNPAKTPNEVV